MIWTCGRLGGFSEQPARKISAIAASAAKKCANPGGARRTGMKLDSEREWARMKTVRRAEPPREFFTMDYAVFRVEGAPCKISIAFFTSGSSAELDGAGG